MKTITILIDEKFYEELVKNCPKDMKKKFYYIELLKKGLKQKRG